MLTACGIETLLRHILQVTSHFLQLQQCLPLAVLKLVTAFFYRNDYVLQQCLPLAVLKLALMCLFDLQTFPSVATVLTACGIET